MRPLLRAYDWLMSALAVVAGLIMVAIFAGVIVDVTIRDFGYQSPRAIQPLAEFGLLYITMLGSPWLLRNKGMIIVESLRMALPGRVRRVGEIVVYVVCIAVVQHARLVRHVPGDPQLGNRRGRSARHHCPALLRLRADVPRVFPDGV